MWKYLISTIVTIFVLASCTPREVAVFKTLEPHQQRAVINHLRSKQDKFSHVLSESALARLRDCESGGNYGIVSSSGAYRGAYQFSRSTWNSVASKHYPHLRGVDPAKASKSSQDAMARALYVTSGRSPWPICGQRI